MYESHVADVGYEGEADVWVEVETSGPIDEEGSSYEVVTGYDVLAVLNVVGEGFGCGPEAGVV